VTLPLLGAHERRVLGVLLEKSLAQTAYYPMTLQAIVSGANQKSNREPVMELDEDAVWSAIEALRQRGLVTRLLPAGSARSDRFKHEVHTVFGWEKPQRAIMAELLLRGPQTIGELRSRCMRMYPFENTDALAAALDALTRADPPFAAPLARSPGQSAVRFTHRFYPDEERSAAGEHALAHPATGDPGHRNPSSPDASATAGELDSLRGHIVSLESQVAELRAMVEDLYRRSASDGGR
jgi:hypothetical protein